MLNVRFVRSCVLARIGRARSRSRNPTKKKKPYRLIPFPPPPPPPFLRAATMASGETSSRRWVPRWPDLPTDILDVIVKKLTRASDYLRFRCVCKSWRSFAKPTNLPSHLPFLVLPYDPDSLQRPVLSLPTREIHARPIPDLVHTVTLASSRGWLLLLDLEHAGERLFLLNPLTGAQVQLPPTDGFLHQTAFEFSWKAYLLLSPNLDPRDSVVVIAECYRSSREIAFCKLGDESWTVMNTGLVTELVSVAHHEGSLYMIDMESNASVCKIASPLNPEPINLPNVDLEGCYLFFVTTSTQLLLFVQYHADLIPDDAVFDDEPFDHFIGVFELKQGNAPGWYKIESIHCNKLYMAMELFSTYLLFGWAIPGRRGDCIFYSSASGFSYRQLKSDFHEIDAFDFEIGYDDHIIRSWCNSTSNEQLAPFWIELNLCKMLE
ncbi:F-box protein SKIP23-like [Phoenix dactylifera]|uniref:F-box protein SKIP23-like n=1 Tax=Phoenix dactylifera TaxID=42345 RepID=A0A8B7BZE7_PHODC|nr:F-box protein SKIP23-like [Phoenix dactylifera]